MQASKIISLPKEVISGERSHPTTRSLWFFDQANALPSGIINVIRVALNSHCFYSPSTVDCF